MSKKGQINIGYKARRIAFNGSEKLVGQADRYSTIPYASIISYAAKAAAVPESSIEMAMEALFDAMNYFVLNGHSVQIPNLGTFSIGVRAKSAADESEFTANFSQNLRNVVIRFLPDSELKQMIASTAISTTVDEENYVAQGAITVRSMSFARGSSLIGMNAGRSYAIPDPAEVIVINGSRLSKDFVGSVPVVLEGYDAEGNTVLIGSPAGALINQQYGQIRVYLKKIMNFHPELAAIKKITVEDSEHNIIVERSFAALAEGPQISAVSVDDVPVAPGGTVKFETGVAKKIRIWGYNLTGATEVKIGNTVVTPSAVNAAYLTVNFTPSVSGNYPVSVKDDTHAASTYNMSFGEAANVIVSSVTANGDALVNGGTTNITAGSNYAIQIAGTGLTNLTVADFTLPAGSTIVITSQSNTLIAATISNAQEGDFKIAWGGNFIFTAALVAVTSNVTLTGYKLGSTEAATQSFETTASQTGNPSYSVYLQGENLDDLSTSDFEQVTGTFSNISYTPATGLLTFTYSSGSAGELAIKSNGTTIATLKVVQVESGGFDVGG
jgi:nucleoid DNA-binding protein